MMTNTYKYILNHFSCVIDRLLPCQQTRHRFEEIKIKHIENSSLSTSYSENLVDNRDEKQFLEYGCIIFRIFDIKIKVIISFLDPTSFIQKCF